MLDEIIIQTKDGIMQIAGLEKGRLGEFVIYDEKKANEGNVYLGKITKKIQTANGKEGYFVNIGASKEAFINAEENDLEDLKAHEGQDIIVQVVQEQRAEKGARMSRFLRLAGVYLVYCPYGNDIEISTKIVDEAVKERLYNLIADNSETGGWIVRTMAADTGNDDILAEMKELKNLFADIIAKAKNSKAPVLLTAKNTVLHDMIYHHADSLQKIIVNNRLLKDEFERILPAEYSAAPFADAGIDDMVEEALRKTVNLNCGGRIIIEETRACTAIDVDSGEGTAQGGLGRLNQEAAAEIVRQIILRNLSGKIIIDFAGIAEFKYLKKALDILEEGLAEDPLKGRVLGLTRAGNVEIIRTRRRPSLRDLLTEECSVCMGTGRVEK